MTVELTDEQIEKLVASAIRDTIAVLQHRVDMAIRDAGEARGIAKEVRDGVDSNIEGLSREIHHAHGRMDNTITELQKEIRLQGERLARGTETLKSMRTSLFGDERPNAPSIQKDIDNLKLRLTAVNTELGTIADLSRRVQDMEKRSEQIYQDLRVFFLIQRVFTGLGDKALKPFWGLFERFKWARWIGTLVGGTGLGTWIYENIIRPLLEAAHK